MAKIAALSAAQPSETPSTHGSDGTRTILYDSGITRIDYISGPSAAARLAVTFAHYGMLDIGGKGFAEEFLCDRGFDVIAVKCNRNNWFQDLSREALREVMEQLPDYDDIIVYGSNMGGYAALYFTGSVGGSICIAVSPQFSVDPARPPHEPRWAAEAAAITFQHRPLDEVLQQDIADLPSLKTHIIYDPRSSDTAHAALIQTAGPRHVIPILAPYSGHPSGFMLAECEAMSPIFDEIVAGRIPQVRPLVAATKSKSVSYLFTLAQECEARGHRKAAGGLYDRAVKLTDRSDIILEHSRFLYRGAKHKRALAQLERAWPSLHRDSHLMAYKAHLQHVTGDDRAARQTFEQVIQMEPDFVAFYQSERYLFKAMLDKQDARMKIMESALSRARDELEIKRGPEPNFNLKLIGQLMIIPLLIVIFIFFAVRFFGIY